MAKTPASYLQELCVKQQAPPPVYNTKVDGATHPDKIFVYVLRAFNQEVEGEGRSKKEAKHVAAQKMLELLNVENMVDGNVDVQNIQSIEGNSVGELMDLCIQRQIPIPKFVLVNASGPSHAPQFIVECSIASMVRQATFSTKKGAKQMVAQKMISLIQNMSFDNDNRTIAKFEDIVDEESQTNSKKIRTYLDWKNAGEKYQPGQKISDRFQYFRNLDDDVKLKVRQIMYEKEYTASEKVYQIVETIGSKYQMTDIKMSSTQGQYKIFEMIGDFDMVIVAPEATVFNNVLVYIDQMTGG